LSTTRLERLLLLKEALSPKYEEQSNGYGNNHQNPENNS
jgi:hypothetical protein